MPAYHLVRPDGSGITMVNIGVGPANAKTITDHIAVLRPHAWIMLGHCAGLPQHAAVGRLRARPRLCPRGSRPRRGTAAVGADPGARRGAGGARSGGRRGHADCKGYELKRVMRTGTVASTDNRNWELLPSRHAASTPGAALQPEPRDRPRHGIGDDRGQRLSVPRAVRHLACASATSRCTARSSCPAWPIISIANASTSTCASASGRSSCCANRASTNSTAASSGASRKSRFNSGRPWPTSDSPQG